MEEGAGAEADLVVEEVWEGLMAVEVEEEGKVAEDIAEHLEGKEEVMEEIQDLVVEGEEDRKSTWKTNPDICS